MENVINISKYNNNYMDRVLNRVEAAIENDDIVSNDDAAKASAIYEHKIAILDRKIERLVNKELNDLRKQNAEADKVLGEEQK